MANFSNDFIEYFGLVNPTLLTQYSFKCIGFPHLISLNVSETPIYSLNRVYISSSEPTLFITIHYASGNLCHPVCSFVTSFEMGTICPSARAIYPIDIFSYLLDPWHIYCYFICIVSIDTLETT